jgi:hypothetical protein
MSDNRMLFKFLTKHIGEVNMKDFNISLMISTMVLMILVSGCSTGTIQLNAHLKSQEESEKLEEGD